MNRNHLLLPLLAVIAGSACRLRPAAEESVWRGLTMGTTYTVRAVTRPPAPPLSAADRQRLRIQLEADLADVNRRMSAFDPASDVSVFNRSTGDAWMPVGSDTATVVRHAREVSALSGGAFDVTVAPVIDLWGFGPRGRRLSPPGDEAIAAARAQTGWQHLHVRLSPPALRRTRPGITCNLSAIAKGFGVDRLASRLRSSGFGDYLVEIGGEVAAAGLNPSGHPWRIGIEQPDSSPQRLQAAVTLRDAAMATSGDYHNFFEQGGVRYSHTIDPQTGRPVRHPLASVTVVASRCMHADAMATAIHVLGPGPGLELARRQRLAVFLIVRSGPGFRTEMTPEFEALLRADD